DKILKVLHRTHLERSDIPLHFFFYSRPQRCRDIRPGGCRAFLALVFKSAAKQCNTNYVGVRAGMCENKILAAGFAYNTRVRFIFMDIVANGLPDVLEDAG